MARRLDWLKSQGAWVTGAAGEAEAAHYEADFSSDTVLVMGGEEKGLKRLTREKCDHLVRIPMAEGVESLNVSVASGIALYALSQR